MQTRRTKTTRRAPAVRVYGLNGRVIELTPIVRILNRRTVALLARLRKEARQHGR